MLGHSRGAVLSASRHVRGFLYRSKSLLEEARRQTLLRQLDLRLRSSSGVDPTPNQVFGHLDEGSWFWMNTKGFRKSPRIRRILPGLPPETVQIHATGGFGDRTLREGFRFYQLIRELYQRLIGNIAACEHILDFGCGWGRILRFLLKDVAPSKLWGADPWAEIIDVARRTNRWCRFELIDPMPPTSFPDGMFDLVFAYSVFSHLSEEVHMEWLREIRRLVKPDGLFIVTTRPREFITEREQMSAHLPDWMKGPPAFPNPQKFLSDYDAGEYVHSRLGHPGSAVFGETCIPRSYVLSRWTRYFHFVDFIDDRKRCAQNAIVVRN